MTKPGRIFVGIGGWTYAPWRGLFYPEDLPKSRELHYASRCLSAIEVNGTYYRTQSEASFAKWREDTPADFMFSLKALRYATSGKVLGDAASAVERFTMSGLTELGAKLGPIVWQFPPAKRFEAADFERFLKLLPQKVRGLPLRHALDVRHESFKSPEFLEMAHRHGAAVVFADTDEHPSFADVTGDFVYARLMRSQAAVKTGYRAKDLEKWAARARLWAAGGEPDDLPRIAPAPPPDQGGAGPRDVFIYFISGAKERNPAAARALLEILRSPGGAPKP